MRCEAAWKLQTLRDFNIIASYEIVSIGCKIYFDLPPMPNPSKEKKSKKMRSALASQN